MTHCYQCGEAPCRCARVGEDVPVTDKLDVEALVGRLEVWLRQCSSWMLAEDLDLTCPMKTDPLDLADDLPALLAHIVGEDARVAAVVAGERERCAQVAEKERDVFASPEYAGGAPLSALGERFACTEVAAAIRETPSA